jgi:hypothetical protein
MSSLTMMRGRSPVRKRLSIPVEDVPIFTSMEIRLTSLEARLARAERRERVLRWMVLTMFVGGVVLLTMRPGVTQGEGNTVRAPFRVVDAQGTTLAQVDTRENVPRLSLLDETGKPVVVIGATSGTAKQERGLEIYDASGRRAATMRTGGDGGMVGVASASGSGGAMLSAEKDGGMLCIIGEAGKLVGSIGADKEGGNFYVADPAGALRAYMGTRNGGMLRIFNEDDKIVANLQARENSGWLTLFDRAANARAQLDATDKGGSLRLADPSGNCVFEKP